MKKSIATALIVAGICLVIGLMIIGCTLAALKGDYSSISQNTEWEEKHYSFDVDEVISFKLTDHNNPVIVRRSSNDKINVTCFDSERQFYEVTDNNGKIVFEFTDNLRFWEYFGFDFDTTDRTIIIEFPTTDASLDISTSNSSINVSELDCSNKAEFRTSNAPITLNDCFFGASLTLNTSNDSISTENVTAGEIEADTSNDPLNFTNLACASLHATTSNGSVVMENVDVNNELIISTSNGSVEMEKINVKNELIISTSNDDITFSDISAASYDFTSSNGSIKGTLPGKISDYNISSDTSNASNSLPERLDGKIKLSVHTSNDDIAIYFE